MNYLSDEIDVECLRNGISFQAIFFMANGKDDNLSSKLRMQLSSASIFTC